MATPTRPLAAFRLPYFPAYFLSNLLQYVSGQLQAFTLQWLVTELTTSRTLLGTVGFVQGASVTLALPAAGVASDRYPKRHLLVIGRVGLAAIVLVMALMVHTGWIAMWHIIVLAIAGGLFSALMQPASQTYVFDLVGRENVQNAIALNSIGTGAAQMLGPALAGVTIAAIGIVGTFVSAAAGALVATGMLALIPVLGRSPHAPRSSPWNELRESLAYVRQHPPVLLALIACSMAVFNGALYSMRPIFARHVLEVGSQGFGMLAAASGVGTLLGAAIATMLPMRRPGLAIAATMLGFATCLLLYSFAFSFAWVLGVELASGLIGQLWNVAAFSGLQLAVPEEMRGRIMSLLMIVVQTAPLGQLFVGVLADAVGDQLAMGIFGAVPMVVLTLLLTFGWRQLREL